jgi:hypothetical protein
MDIRIEGDKKPYDPSDDVRNGAIPGEKKTPRKTAPPRPVRDQPSFPQMQESIEEFYVLAGALLAQYPSEKTKMIGTAIGTNAGVCAESIIEAAKKDPRLRRILVRLTTAGVYSGIFVAHLPILMAAYVAYAGPMDIKMPTTVNEESDVA